VDPLTWFSQLDPNQIALGALVTLMIASIITGRMIPKSVHDDRIADKDKIISGVEGEREDWKTAFFKKSDETTELVKQNGELIASAETANRLMESLRAQADRNYNYSNPRQNES